MAQVSHELRHYYRCRRCLGVAVAESTSLDGVRCDCGGAEWWYLGRVQRDRLVRDDARPPCDARCTGALGPTCNCRCGGKNHGSGRVVVIAVDAGSVPRVSDRDDLGVRLERVREYEAARQPLQEELAELEREREERRWLDRERYDRMLALRHALIDADAAKHHATRMRTLRRAAACVSGSSA